MESVERLYVDSNILIYLFESQDSRAEKLRQLFLIERSAPSPFLATSELTLSEVLVQPYRTADERLIQIYSNWTITNSYLEVGPIRREILWRAAILRSYYEALRLPDAIHLATAFAFRCSHFLTGDLRMKEHYEFVDTRSHLADPSRTMVVLRPEIEVLEHLVAQA